jgi:hypothetical protein
MDYIALNLKIAKAIGAKVSEDESRIEFPSELTNVSESLKDLKVCSPKNLKFHQSWDWVMMALKQISKERDLELKFKSKRFISEIKSKLLMQKSEIYIFGHKSEILNTYYSILKHYKIEHQ